ncbi:MAG: hypothetical protein PHE33_11970 [Bacteroidales bacterium]|nr:hypothetical protein [Bacteroidales bacterium]
MANRRELKKDLNWLTHVVISDCLIYVEINPDKDHTPVGEIINEVIQHRDAAFSEVNMSTAGMDRKEVKQKYNNIVNNFFDVSNTCFEKLSELSKK